jgi:hypothetical protein
MHLRTALPEILPQPFSNMYQDYQLVNKQNIDGYTRLEAIQRISKDCFRLLLTIPLVILMRVGYAYSTNNMAGIIALGIFAISPSSSMLVGAGFFSLLSISSIVNAVAKRCFSHIGEAVFAALIAGHLSENYQRYENTLLGISERWLMLIPTKISAMIFPNEIDDGVNSSPSTVSRMINFCRSFF